MKEARLPGSRWKLDERKGALNSSDGVIAGHCALIGILSPAPRRYDAVMEQQKRITFEMAVATIIVAISGILACLTGRHDRSRPPSSQEAAVIKVVVEELRANMK